MQRAISCRGIKKSYGKKENRVEALKDINLDIPLGKLSLLVGPSGSGKTTLLSIITTILTPDEGELFLLDHAIKGLSEQAKSEFRRDYLGIVFQSLFLVPTLTVLENVALPLIISGVSQDVACRRAFELLEVMNLASRSEVSPAFLSKGQQQRVAISRAMINNAKIIVCDEPTSALDQAAGLEVMSLLKKLSQDTARAVLVVTHDQRIFPFADQIFKISDGQIMGSNNE